MPFRSIHCGSATCPARRLQLPSQFHFPTKSSSTLQSNLILFFQSLFYAHFTSTDLISILFLPDLLHGNASVFAHILLPSQISQHTKNNSLVTAESLTTELLDSFTYFCTYLSHSSQTLLIHTAKATSFNLFGHLGLRWGLIRSGLGTHIRH